MADRLPASRSKTSALQTCTQLDCMENYAFYRKLILTMTTNNPSSAVEQIVKHFSRMESSAQPKWLAPLRKAGIARFADQGFPTLHDEDWRFTNVGPMAKLPFHLAGEAAVNGAETAALGESVFARLPGHRLVFVNGFFSAKLSSIKPVAGGVRIENLSTALAKDSGFIEKHLGK